MKEYIFTCLALHCRIAEMYVPIDSWVNYFFIFTGYTPFFFFFFTSHSLSLSPHPPLFFSRSLLFCDNCDEDYLFLQQTYFDVSFYHLQEYISMYSIPVFWKGFLIKKLVYNLFDLYLACQQGLYIYA